MYNVTAKCHTPLWLESGEICTGCRRDFKFTFEKSPSRETEAKRRCTSANFSAALTARRSNPWKSCVNPPAAFLRRTLIREKQATSVLTTFYHKRHTCTAHVAHLKNFPFSRLCLSPSPSPLPPLSSFSVIRLWSYLDKIWFIEIKHKIKIPLYKQYKVSVTA